MKLLKPAVAALVAAGLVGSAFAASGSFHYKSSRKYSQVKARSCGASVLSAAVGNSYHAMGCSSKHLYGNLTFGWANAKGKYTPGATEGKLSSFMLTEANLGLDANVSKQVSAHVTLTHDNNWIKSKALANTGDTAVSIKVDQANLFQLREAYFVYHDSPVFVKGGQFNLPVAASNEQNRMIKSFTHSFTDLNRAALQLGFYNNAGFDGGLFVYQGFKKVLTDNDKLAFGATANFHGMQQGIGYKLHASAVSDSRSNLDQELDTDFNGYKSPLTHDDNLVVGQALANGNLVANTKAKMLYNAGFDLAFDNVHGGVTYTHLNNISTTAPKVELGLVKFDLGFSHKMNNLPVSAGVYYELANTNSDNLLNVKHSLGVHAGARLTKHMGVHLAFVQDKGAKNASNTNSRYFFVGTRVNF